VDVDIESLRFEEEGAVLGHALLGDIEARQDLDPGDEFFGEHHRQVLCQHHDAVEAEADDQIVFGRLDMHVRGIEVDGAQQQFFEQLADGMDVIALAEQVADLDRGVELASS
jgi:hypothetical protein